MSETRRKSILRGLVFAGLALLVSSQSLVADDGPFESVHVAANRVRYVGRDCPVEIIYTATIDLEPRRTGLVFNYHWERSDGAKSAVQIMRPRPGQSTVVLHESWRLGGPGHDYDASVRLFVNSGNTHLERRSPVVRIICR
jgi:hypothetical protein